MKSRLEVRRSLVGVLTGVLIGGGLMAVTPAGAEVAQVAKAAATNWNKIWKKEIRPKADKRYYTKKKTRQKFAKKSALADFYTKGQSESRYAAAGSSYTKSESDGRYARSTDLVRGNVMIVFSATAAGQLGGSEISFGKTFAAAPAIHVIAPGAVPPAGCSGSATAPDASPGHLCIFGSLLSNAGAPNTCKVSTSACFGAATDPWGASIFINATGAGAAQYFATWAARPTALSATASGRVRARGDRNQAAGPSTGVVR